ncbi:MAG: oligosaccharide flippase family protein [Kaiparowitsia implicata GSE-PSE-MK54-09C]|jgi:O-antigen/teichoic acid export membrane protein|nr:oligosaccharide flippase family protein [Kaiparowitsia implicata GSE-PSE-MK54-09C]
MIANLLRFKSSIKLATQWILKGQDSTSAVLQTVLSRFLIIGVNVGTGIITARFLGPEGRGEQSAMILWPMFLANTLTLGLPTSVVYNFRKYPEERAKFFAAALLIGTLTGLAATIFGIALMPLLLKNYSGEVVTFARLLMFNSPIVLVQLIILSALEANGEFSASNRLRLLIPSITLLLLILLLVINALNPFTSSLAYVLNGIPIFAWTLVQLWKRIKPQWSNLRSATRRLLDYGFRSYGISLLGTVAANIDQALVVGFLSPTAMGTYVVALSLSRMLSVFQEAFKTVLFPKTAGQPVDEIIRMTGQAARVNLILMISIGLITVILSPLLLNLLYGSEFIEAAPTLNILVVQVVVNGTTMVLAQAFMASGKPGTVTVLQGIGLGLNIPCMIFLIPSMGLIGAALSLLISTSFRLAFILVSFPLFLKARPPSLIITKQDIRLITQKVLALGRS